MRLEVVQVTVSSPTEKGVITDQWAAVVYDGRRKVFTSTGYNYALEARDAGLYWMSLQEAKR